MRSSLGFGLFLLLLSGCTRPSLLVCREVLDSGTCRQPVTELATGHEYFIFGTGLGMPHGYVTLQVVRLHGNVGQDVAEARVRVSADAKYFRNPLRLVDAGTYRVDVFDEEGELFQSTQVRVISSTSAPGRSNAR